jgi:hypothetical protein
MKNSNSITKSYEPIPVKQEHNPDAILVPQTEREHRIKILTLQGYSRYEAEQFLFEEEIAAMRDNWFWDSESYE